MSPRGVSPGPVIRLAPAKLNLTLAVGPRRADGFHPLHSVMAPLALADRLSLDRAVSAVDSLHVAGGPAPAGNDNLVLKAIAAARRAVGRSVETFPLAARLEKVVPMAAGLAGGSSDAAAALDGAIEAWGAELATDERARIAAGLGSDVPFFLAGGMALVEGRGEHVTPLAGVQGEPLGVLLVTPAVGASTAAVFSAFDAGGEAAPADPNSTRRSSEHLAQELHAGLRAHDLVVRAGVLASANDLANASALVVPGLRALRRALVRRLGRAVGQSGSGPTLWALYPSFVAAEAAATEVLAGLADGTIVAPGDVAPSVMPTTIQPSTERSRS